MSSTLRCATSDTRRPGAVGGAERGLVLEARRRFEQPRHFLDAQHLRQLARIADDDQRRARSRRFSVTVNKNRNAETALLIVAGPMPFSC